MDYENVFYMDGSGGGYIDGRNAARPVVISHSGTRLPARTTAIPAPAAAASMGTMTHAPYQYQYPMSQPAFYNTAWAGYPANPQYVVPQVAPPSNLASILGGFGDIGTLANIIAQAFAAFLPLPASPAPQDNTDNDSIAQSTLANSSNLIRYQNALAQFARRDQQILTLGSVLKELFKRPGVVG